ncbi:MAG TPA: hypothetical protein VEK56_07180, partial [Vicinamibacterales bacterium]|nr:hypothetical protein [Vicinamibacterales bacterium]
YLTAQLERWRFPLIDCQMRTSHLASLGAREIPRRQFVKTVERLVKDPGRSGRWQLDGDLAGTWG